jgi:hypothetical protein
VLLRAAALPADLLARLAQTAASTHMAPCIVCASEEEMERAARLRAVIAVESPALLDRAPPRTLLIALSVAAGLRGRVDAVLDPAMADPRAFRASLEEET